MLPKAAALTKGTWTNWLKFIYNGKILFVPNTGAGAAAQPFALPRFLHNTGYANLGPHLFDATKVATCQAAAPEVLNTTVALATAGPVNLVLELIP